MTPPAVTSPRAVDPRVVRTRNDVLRVTLELLIDAGPDAVTHQHVARIAGYAKGTLYAHWPTRTALIHAALARYVDGPHHAPTGDLRADLVRELLAFRAAMHEQRLDRVLAVLADLAPTSPDLAPVRDRLVIGGERVVRELLAPVLHGPDLEAATLMLGGAVSHAALMHGRPPDDAIIESAVDLVLAGLPAARRP